MPYNSDKKINDELPVISKIGFCKYKGELTNRPLDVEANRAVQFWFNYQWTPPAPDSTDWTCVISNINWRARSNISGTPEWCGLGRSIEEPNGSVLSNHDEYCQPNHLTITFNTDTFAPADTSLYISSPSGYHYATGLTVSTDQKFIIANFKYSYTKNEVEYLVEIPNIKISRPTKYDKNLVFTEAGLNELIANIKRYPVIDVTTTGADIGKLWIKYGDSSKNTQVKVGSDITFPEGTKGNSSSNGRIEITIDGTTHYPLLQGKLSLDKGGTGRDFSNVPPYAIIRASSDLTTYPFFYYEQTKSGALYATSQDGAPTFGTLPVAQGGTGKTTVAEAWTALGGGSVGKLNIDGTNSTKYLRGDGTWVTITTTDTKNTAGAGAQGNDSIYMIGAKGSTTSDSKTTYQSTSAYVTKDGYFYSTRVYNAVFNDYAEYRTTINLTPGHVVIDNDDGSLTCSSARLQPGAQVISDTFGHSMGETDAAKTPLAVAGRVLVYTYQPRENYHAGMAVCSAPDGTIDIMTREEIRDYPDCIIGIVSEIPQYETWGSDNVKVDGRIWIKVK